MPKIETVRKIESYGPDAAFLANVISTWDSAPSRKLRGLLKLLSTGNDVRLADMDHLTINGVNHGSRRTLEEYA